ncbi:ABC1 kinase family protein [Oceanobacillus damuensis]|uniref:ABC1 kinase family protein n=1 Tax=Oceanobacillus damuensis TaxID=937928 RepID=UPI0008323108|nr:AarF/UbiB family protein [Oceanobacillus damuensis]
MGKLFKYNILYRSIIIVWMAVKFIIKIYYFNFKNKVWDKKTVEKWDNMLYEMAMEYRKKAEHLGGVLIKVGQFLSTRTDFMPDVFIRELDELVDHVPPMPHETAISSIEKEWATDLFHHLSEIEDSATASASIGDVYRAKLKDGSEVAIKVRRHRIEEVFHKDFVALRIVFWILRVFTSFGKKADLNALYKELVLVMNRELDYEQELKYGEYFRERFKEDTAIHIPKYYHYLCTEKVLVMEWVRGAKITDISFIQQHNIDIEKTTKSLFDHYITQFLNPGKFHADPHSGNILIQKDGTIAIIDFGMVGEIKKEDTEQFKLLVQGIIIDNYDMVISALDKMNFILPNADKKKLKKVIKETVDIYSDGSLKNIDSEIMNQLSEDIGIIIKDQPIQMPADYAYLLRAVSIVIGILFAIHPDMDIKKWAIPRIKKWFGRRSIVESVTKQYTKNLTEPVLSYPRALLNFLESGEKDRKWDKEKHYIQMKHQFYLLLEVISFMMVVTGIAVSIWGFSIQVNTMAIIGLVLTVVFLFTLNLIFVKHYRMIRSRK